MTHVLKIQIQETTTMVGLGISLNIRRTIADNTLDIINSWEDVDDISEMQESEMCSYCYLEKFKLMQESLYSVYDSDAFKARYEYVSNGELNNHVYS